MLFDIPNDEIFRIPGNMFINKELESPMEGLKKGNMFKDEYMPYKNLTFFDVVPKDDRCRLLLEIMSYSFAINDLNLYLDLHSDDKEMYKVFKAYVKKEMELEEVYVNKYGPLCVSDASSSFNWVNNPWPFDNKGGVDYV